MPVVDYAIGGVGWLAPGGVGWLARGTGNGRSGRSSADISDIAHCQQTVAHGRKQIRLLVGGLLQDVLSNNRVGAHCPPLNDETNWMVFYITDNRCTPDNRFIPDNVCIPDRLNLPEHNDRTYKSRHHSTSPDHKPIGPQRHSQRTWNATNDATKRPSSTETLTVPICVTRNNEDLSLHYLSSFVAQIEPDKRPPIPTLRNDSLRVRTSFRPIAFRSLECGAPPCLTRP